MVFSRVTVAVVAALAYSSPALSAPGIVPAPAPAPAPADPKTPVSADVYGDLSHYATLIAPAPSYPGSPCKNPPFGTQILKFYSTPITSTQALLYRDDARREFVLAIPGTSGLRDQITDTTTLGLLYLAPEVNCPGLCEVHLGFLDAWNSLYPKIKDDMLNNLKQYPEYTTTITGHSLGAAIATLAFATLKADSAFRVTRAYTYGGPRVGNQPFANYIDSLSGASDTNPGNFFRVTHANDPIPNSIPYNLGFRHSREEYWEENMSPSLQSTVRCFGQEPDDCNLATSGETIEDMPAHTSYAGLSYFGCNG